MGAGGAAVPWCVVGGKPSPEFPFRGNYRPRHWPGAHCLPLFGKGGAASLQQAPRCLLARAPLRVAPVRTSLFALTETDADGGGDADDLTHPQRRCARGVYSKSNKWPGQCFFIWWGK